MIGEATSEIRRQKRNKEVSKQILEPKLNGIRGRTPAMAVVGGHDYFIFH